MIKITRNNGASVLTVSRSAFEEIFRRQGYVQVETSPHPSPLPEGEGTKSDDDLFLESVEAKPISKWSDEELRRYAVLIGIEQQAADTMKVAELRKVIAEAIKTQTVLAGLVDGGKQTDSEE